MQTGMQWFWRTRMKPWNHENLPPLPGEEPDPLIVRQNRTRKARISHYADVEKWQHDLKKIFAEIFENSEPQVRLLDMRFPKPKYEESWKLEEFIHSKLSIIADYYRLIEEQMFSSLRYIDSRLALVYGDAVVELGENSNEQSLCKFLFENFDLEQRVPLHKVHEYITGEPLPANPRAKGAKVVQSAVNSVNRKTKKSFGFSVFSHPRGTVFIKNPKTRNLS